MCSSLPRGWIWPERGRVWNLITSIPRVICKWITSFCPTCWCQGTCRSRLWLGSCGFCRQKKWQNSVLFLVSFMHVWYVDKKWSRIRGIFRHKVCMVLPISLLFEQNLPLFEQNPPVPNYGGDLHVPQISGRNLAATYP